MIVSQKKMFCGFLLAIWILFQGSQLSAKEPAEYQVKHESITLQNTGKTDDRVITAELFYPSTDKKTIAEGRFPFILFAHGYQQRFSDYHNIWETLVPKGYIFAFITTFQGLTINIDDYTQDIISLYRHLSRDDGQNPTLLRGHLSEKSALMGHSTGGGAIYLAQPFLPQVTTLVSMAALGRTYGPITGSAAIDMADKITIPSLILSGSSDCICPPAVYQIPLYGHLAGSKAMVMIEGGDHCGFSDSSNCPIAESLSCGIVFQGQTIPEAKQRALTMKIVLPWLNHFLKGKPKAWNTFESILKNDQLKFNLDVR